MTPVPVRKPKGVNSQTPPLREDTQTKINNSHRLGTRL